MNFSNVCRTCLSDKDLNPLFLNPKDHVQYANAVYIALGIKVHPHDGLPQKMCKSCEDHLNSCLRFRTKCKEVEQKLLSFKKPVPTRPRVKKKPKKVQDDESNFRVSPRRFQIKSNGVTYMMTEIIEEQNKKKENSSVAKDKKKLVKPKLEPVAQISQNYLMVEESISSEDIQRLDDLNNKSADKRSAEYTEYDWLEDDVEIDENWPPQHTIIKTDIEELNEESDQMSQAPQLKSDVEQQPEITKLDSESTNQLPESAEVDESTEKPTFSGDDDEQENGEENMEVYSDDYDNVEKPIKQERVDIEVTRVPSCLYTINEAGTRATCRLCAADFPANDVQHHFTEFHSETDEEEEEEQTNCEEFFTKTTAASPLTIAQRPVQAPSVNKILKCGYCKTEFDNRDILIKHVTSCRRKLNLTNTQTTKPVPESEQKSPEPMECGDCHQVVMSNKLWQHRILYHVNSVVCEHCGKNFKSKHRLQAHKRSKHGYEKLKCPLCDLEFASQVSLKNHERRHRGEKPYVCDICGSKFHASYLLAQHKKFHRITRMFKCDQCSASFKTNLGLYNHKRGRHSTLLVKCELCNRTYSCRHYAMKHLRYMHQFKGGGRAPLEVFQLESLPGANSSPLGGQSPQGEGEDDNEMVDDSEVEFEGDIGDVDGEN